MIVVMRTGATAKEVASVIARIEADGHRAHLSEGEERTIVGVIGSDAPKREENYSTMSGVEKVLRVSTPFKMASRNMNPKDTLVALNGNQMGGQKVLVIAGPCSVEGRQQIIDIACAAKEMGATALRGGAYKPRTSPYSFQGHGERGLEWLAEARAASGLPIVTEVMEPELVPLVARYADVLQVGARNMQNYALLNAVGESGHTVLLKRGLAATLEELLMSAEYILSKGNRRLMLCERGIRTYETHTRNTFDINAIPALKALTHLPIVADPSHGTGKSEYVEAVALGAVAAGADGLIVEIHPEPENAMSDGRQSLTYPAFQRMMDKIKRVAEAVDRSA